MLLFSSFLKANTLDLAVTFDDFPYIRKNPPPGYSNKKLIKDLVRVLKKHHISGVVAFVNAARMESEEGKEIINLWIKEGHFLGNHTWDHADLNKVSKEQFVAMIQKNSEELEKYNSSFLRLFRFPFLHEGNTQEKRDFIREYLIHTSYQIAQVTVDHNDWQWL